MSGETEAINGKAGSTRESVDLSGQTLGDYQLLRRIGEGGMGQVYLAEQISLKRRVALKLLRPDLASNEASRRRFEAEAKAVAQLTHANIVQVYQVGEHGGRNFMALEFVDGRNLREYLARKGPPEPKVALAIMRQIAAALHRAGELGIVHRDIKPENILLTKNGEVKVADFGLARMNEGEPAVNLTQTGVTMGTPLYMSPEQVEGKPLDPRSDIYSMGVTCYHLLAGEPPFAGDNAFAVALQHVQTEPTPLADQRPDLPPELCAIVTRMMNKRPEDRYQTARDILKDIKHFSEMQQSGISKPLIATTPLPKRGAATLAFPTLGGGARRHGVSFAVIALLVLGSLLLVGGIGSALGWLFSPKPIAETPIPSSRNGDEELDLDDQSDRAREKAMYARVKQTQNPDKPDAVADGLRYRVDLAAFYLEQTPRELEKADKFFKEQASSSVAQYKTFGKLGEAIVLAYRDQPESSSKAILALWDDLTTKRVADKPENFILRPEFFIQVPRLRKLLNDALHHNRLNWEQLKEPKPTYPNNLRLMENRLRLKP